MPSETSTGYVVTVQWRAWLRWRWYLYGEAPSNPGHPNWSDITADGYAWTERRAYAKARRAMARAKRREDSYRVEPLHV